MTTTTSTASDTFDAMTERDDWLGFGYLGERNAAREYGSRMIPTVDQIVADYAERQGWTDADLFAWANSKNGRWFGERMLGVTSVRELDETFSTCVNQGLLTIALSGTIRR